jgi:hypothetical protein
MAEAISLASGDAAGEYLNPASARCVGAQNSILVGIDLKSYRRIPTLCLYPASTPRSSSLREMPNPLLIVNRVVRDGTLLPRSIKLTAVRCRPQ